ncbi:unnamed protein product, partial [Iphiclides podalirius]
MRYRKRRARIILALDASVRALELGTALLGRQKRGSTWRGRRASSAPLSPRLPRPPRLLTCCRLHLSCSVRLANYARSIDPILSYISNSSYRTPFIKKRAANDAAACQLTQTSSRTAHARHESEQMIRVLSAAVRPRYEIFHQIARQLGLNREVAAGAATVLSPAGLYLTPRMPILCVGVSASDGIPSWPFKPLRRVSDGWGALGGPLSGLRAMTENSVSSLFI